MHQKLKILKWKPKVNIHRLIEEMISYEQTLSMLKNKKIYLAGHNGHVGKH